MSWLNRKRCRRVAATMTDVLQPKLYRVIFISVLLNSLPCLSTQQHHDLPAFVQNIKDYPFRTTFIQTGDTKPVAELDWRIDDDAVEFRLRTAVIPSDTEWIAFGMSSNGSLIEADLIVVWLHGNMIVFHDFWTDEAGNLHKDDHQDYILTESDIIADDQLEIAFSRPMDTCDTRDYLIENGTDHLLFLRGNQQDPSDMRVSDNLTTFAMRRIQLMKNRRQVPGLPRDVQTDEVLVDKITVPSDSTTYWCKVYEFTQVTSKHHIIRYEAVVTPGNEDLVHHMEVYNCEVRHGQPLPNYSGPCTAEDKPSSLESCKHVIGAWAMGAEPFIYPDEVGIAIGEPGTSAYVMIEVHYNNPTHREGVVDDSGIRFYHTPTLRPNDAGILEVGVVYSPNQSVPPNSRDFVLTGYCTSECSKKGLPAGGIRVFASQLHTHLTGVAVWTEHVRRGIELKELNRDNHYSAHFQEIRMLPKDVKILPGDTLITHCRYDTRSRQNVTLGGYGIEDEMCVNYIHYYPQSNLEVCKSTLSKKTLDEFLTSVGDGDRNMDVAESLRRVHWNRISKQLWQHVIEKAPIDSECLQSSGLPFPGDWTNQRPPIAWLPRPKRKRHCSALDWKHLLSRLSYFT